MPINFFKHLATQNRKHILRFDPPEDLREIVEGFYFCRDGFPGENVLFFNDGYPVITFMQRPDENVRILIEGQLSSVGSAWVCGGILKNAYCTAPNHFSNCLVIRFYAVTFFKLFGINEGRFQKNHVFDFSEIAGPGFEILKNTYYRCSSVEEKIKITAAYLSKKVIPYSYPKVLVDIQEYIDRNGRVTVKDILERYKVRLNYKWLERNFKRHLGISPQNYLLARRFLNAYIDLNTLNNKDLLQVAIDNGYCDDNHFIKDFRRFSGLPPKTYLKRSMSNAKGS